MSVPKQRKTKSQRKIKENSNKLKPPKLSVCIKCKNPIIPHHACSACGTYNKKEVFQTKEKKKERKKKIKNKKQE